MNHLEQAIKLTRESLKDSERYAYLPEILQTLEAIASTKDSMKRRRLVSGLGRLASEDIEFLEGPLGGLLSDLVTELSGEST